ncbi:hypothetical protein L0663_17870 [Dyadobacter sp. CY107]|uniref:hypothetical protein n=1 Tax=Dyadobacter fanqingshengii TaxID=2906443 RepID=UPI001F31A281|nr:hypothetical protein [Dyadobacter fanqingshengii]MCF2505265.1 hypothetical protein [Dyadobacter fanqingshengii]
MTTRELYHSVGLSTSDIAKIDDPTFVWVIAAFAKRADEPAAAFSDFGSALNLVKRVNAFVEGGVGLRPVLKSTNKLKTDRYKRLVDVGLTPYMVSFNNNRNGIELIDDLSGNLDELSVDMLMRNLNRIGETMPVDLSDNLYGTFWAPNGHLAIKKAKVFKAVLDSLKDKRPVDFV